MKEFTKRVVGDFTVRVEITEEMVETVITNSVEGISGHWMGIDNTTEGWEEKPEDVPVSTWMAHMLLDGKVITIFDTDHPDETGELTLDKLIEGFRLNTQNRPFDADVEEGDEITADCIVQYALFGELVYG